MKSRQNQFSPTLHKPFLETCNSITTNSKLNSFQMFLDKYPDSTQKHFQTTEIIPSIKKCILKLAHKSENASILHGNFQQNDCW